MDGPATSDDGPGTRRRALPAGLLGCGASMALIGRRAVTVGHESDVLSYLAQLGGVMVAVGLMAAARDQGARRPIGMAVLVAAGLLTVLWVTGGGELIWGEDEGEAFLALVGLGFSGLALWVTGHVQPPRAPSEVPAAEPIAPPAPAGGPSQLSRAGVRFTLYLGLVLLGMFVAFEAGVSHVEATECGGPDFGGECDLAALGGIVWALGALVGVVAAATVAEAVLLARRRRARRAARGT